MIDLKCGDCLELIKDIPDNSVNLAVLDPPYEVDVDHDGGKLYHNKGFDKSNVEIVKDEIDKGYNITSLGKELFRIMPHLNAYFFCNKKQIPDYFDFYVNEHKCLFEIIVWNKGNALPTYNGKYLTDSEYCLYFFEPGYKLCHPDNYEDAKTLFQSPINSKDKAKYKHPTIKPLPLIEKLIRNSSYENDVVLDCFMGSGTTGVACVNLNRNFIGIEIKKDYFDIATERIHSAEKQNSLQLF